MNTCVKCGHEFDWMEVFQYEGRLCCFDCLPLDYALDDGLTKRMWVAAHTIVEGSLIYIDTEHKP